MDYAIRSWYLLVPWANLCFFALTTFLKWFHLAVHYKTLASIDLISRARRAAAPKGPSNIHLSPFLLHIYPWNLLLISVSSAAHNLESFRWYQWGESPNYQYGHINCSTGVCILMWISQLVHLIFLAVSFYLCLCCVVSCLSIMVGLSLCVCSFLSWIIFDLAGCKLVIVNAIMISKLVNHLTNELSRELLISYECVCISILSKL
jgi:hypothetical protein